jgi:hypothetical protein
MTKRDIIDVQLESFYGSKFPRKIQRLINEELNHGKWVDGYHLAGEKGVIEGSAARELLRIVLAQHPDLRIDEDALRTVVEERLPQSLGARVLWIVDDSGSFALTDSLRVARFEGASLIWKSPRISFDGIALDSIADGKIFGRAWWLGSQETPYAPFILDFASGHVLEGRIVQHE